MKLVQKKMQFCGNIICDFVQIKLNDLVKRIKFYVNLIEKKNPSNKCI